MAFCTRCGTKLDDGVRFCSRCGTQAGAVQPASATEPSGAASQATASPAPVAQSQRAGNNLLKVLLIVGGIVALLGIVAVSLVSYAGYRASQAVRVDTKGNVTSVETRFGTVTTNQDTKTIADQLGIAVYPGATPLEGAGLVSFGNKGVFGTAEFKTSDAPEKVEEFYKRQFPKISMSSFEENQRTLIASTPHSVVTIVMERVEDGTIIRIGKAEGTGNPGNSN